MRATLCSILVGLTFLAISCESTSETENKSIVLIPKPQELAVHDGTFLLSNEATLFATPEFNTASGFLRKYFQQGVNITLENNTRNAATIVLQKSDSLAEEEYELQIDGKQIVITAATNAGAFYGLQTLRQLLPANWEQPNSSTASAIRLPQLHIKDSPTFPYRGMHLDVSRHFFPKEFIKQYIAHLAMLKMNRFHWHLTDDQGWRIEIKAYPKLTTHAAFRNETLLGHYNDSPQQYDGKRYGGFYSQEDIKEIVAFAEAHNVTIIPEIEMPGHSQAAISAYPELGCTNETIPVLTKWGVSEHILCPNKETFDFLKSVLTEVIALFPGEYIHIGGDEAPKIQWENCSHCQQLIKSHKLGDEHGLQSWFIKEIEAFVNKNGKQIIGWDEILEGGLAPNATVMSWRGTEGAVTAAKQGHDVILTPTSHAYFDYYQDDHPDEPLAIGGYLPLQKVYGFNPVPDDLSETEAKHVLGAQGNIWTEYIKTTDQVEYMAFPRMLAMSEVVWTGPSKNKEEDYLEFIARVEPFLTRLEALDINYANHLYTVEGEIEKRDGQLYYTLTTTTSGKTIKYKLNNSSAQIYEGPIAIEKDASIEAYLEKDGKQIGRTLTETITYHKGVTASISLNTTPHDAYGAGGKNALINGISGSDSRYGDKEWLGFWGEDVRITIDLERPTNIRSLKTRFYNANGQWIYAPPYITVRLTLENGSMQTVSTRLDAAPENTLVPVMINFEKAPAKVRQLQIEIPSYGIIPQGKQGAGNASWIFIDEIIVR